jgi:outer membrane protein
MKKVKILLLLWVVAFFGFNLSAQTLKFGHVDLNEVFTEMPEFNNIQKTLDDETSKLEMQFTVMREELQKLESEYAKNREKLTAQQRQEKEKEYTEMAEKVQAFFTNAQQSLKQKQQELQTPVLDKLLKAVQAVGDEEGFLYIFQINSERELTLYRSQKSVDVTPLVKKKLGVK